VCYRIQERNFILSILRSPYLQRHIIFNMPTAAKDKAIEHKIEKLRDEMRRHEYLYYVLEAPEVPDADVDGLMQELKKLEAAHPALITPHSPTPRVGGKPRQGLIKADHPRPMLSLANALNDQDMR